MAPYRLNELFTLILAITAILLGIAMNARSATLRRPCSTSPARRTSGCPRRMRAASAAPLRCRTGEGEIITSATRPNESPATLETS